MSRNFYNTRLAVALVIVLLMVGAAAGRAMHIHHQHSVHTRALAVDSTCLVCTLSPLATSTFALPVPPIQKLARPEQLALDDHENGSLSEPVTRPPPTIA
jgi:hypothetical protein